MLDIKFIRENTDAIRKTIQNKRVDLNIDELLDLDAQRRSLLTETESLQATKNAVSKEIINLQAEEKKAKILEMQEVDKTATELLGKLREVEARFNALMLMVPNIPSPESPIGKDDSENVPWEYWSESTGKIEAKDPKVAEVPTKFNFEPKDHIALGTSLDLIDLDAGVGASGFRGYYLKNEAALMQQGLLLYALEKLQAKGFTPMVTPTLVRGSALTGSGHFPFDTNNIYQVASAGSLSKGEPIDEKGAVYLAGTSEPSLLAYFADKILDESELPVKVCAVSPCYRSEIGSYGKDTKGLYRVHEFMKVEQVVLCKADGMEGDQWLENLREIAQEILIDLKLPHRVINVCTGDMGAGKYKMYDIETWMPSRNGYGETHSDSNLTDWQARRLNIKYRTADGATKYVFTLNNTAVASPRILIPILENYQQADGTVAVPEVLRKYVGTDVIKPKQ